MLILFQVLLEVGGDTDAAIEFLVAEQGAEDYTVENNLSPCHMDISHGNGQSVYLAYSRYFHEAYHKVMFI